MCPLHKEQGTNLTVTTVGATQGGGSGGGGWWAIDSTSLFSCCSSHAQFLGFVDTLKLGCGFRI